MCPVVCVDGISLGAGGRETEDRAVVYPEAREDGAKELLAMEPGYRESTEGWEGVLRDLRDRGFEAPLLAAADGALVL